MFYQRRITIISIRKPKIENSLNDELQWFGNSLGLFHLRDKDKSCFRLFIELIKAAKQGQSLSSDDLAERLGLSRGTVIHHMNRLMESGLVIHDRKKYILKEPRLEVLVDTIKRDFERTCEDLKLVAKRLDKMLEL